MNRILTYVHAGKFGGLNNELLHKLGGMIKFYPGMPDFLKTVKGIIEKDVVFAQFEIKLEHYIVSTGLKKMIEGSRVLGSEYGVEKVWGCTFIEEVPPPGFHDGSDPKREKTPISQMGYVIDNTSKTRAVFEINKGTNKRTDIHVNAKIDKEYRRVPFGNMIYIADGPSDVPVFSIIKQYKGKTYAVYDPNDDKSFATAYSLRHEQDRVDAFGEANYSEGSHTYKWIVHSAREIAKRIARDCERFVEEKVKKPPVHLTEVREESRVLVQETEKAKEAAREQATKRVQIKVDKPITFEEFVSLLGNAGLKAGESEFRRSYNALMSLRTSKHITWLVVREKVRRLEEDLNVGRSQGDLMQGEVKELKAATSYNQKVCK